MRTETIKEAQKLAMRFAGLCGLVLDERGTDPTCGITGTRKSGAMRRASMELTRKLADLRGGR